jgi:hypothetical protein
VLIRFEASNYRSLGEPVEISMVAVDRDRPEARNEPHLGESLLTVAAIFGPNASGKSNILSALVWLRDAVQHSLRYWEDDIPLEPFAFGNGPAETSSFTFESAVDGVRFEYALELDKERVHYEGLFHYPEKKRRRIYEREGSELKLQRGLGALSGTRDLLTDRALALSIARRFDEPLVSRFVEDILQIQNFGVTARRPRENLDPAYAFRPGLHTGPTMRWFEEPNQPTLFGDTQAPHEREQALALLRLADLGIDDVLIDTREPDPTRIQAQRRVRLLHKTADRSTPLDFSAESEGTRTWFQLIGPILTALRQGSVVVFDELDASLHPTLSAELLRLFHDPLLNPRGAQLIFTSHDTSLLNHLNRDEVWLTEKRATGATRLGALADFAGERVRKSQNLENAYLHGRFGAVPKVDQADLLRAFGLIG